MYTDKPHQQEHFLLLSTPSGSRILAGVAIEVPPLLNICLFHSFTCPLPLDHWVMMQGSPFHLCHSCRHGLHSVAMGLAHLSVKLTGDTLLEKGSHTLAWGAVRSCLWYCQSSLEKSCKTMLGACERHKVNSQPYLAKQVFRGPELPRSALETHAMSRRAHDSFVEEVKPEV